MADIDLKDIEFIIKDPTTPGGIKGFNFNQNDAIGVSNVQLKNDGNDTNILGGNDSQSLTFTVPGDIVANIPDGKSFKFNDKSKNFTVSISADGADVDNKKITNLADGTAEKDAVNKSQIDEKINASDKATGSDVDSGTDDKKYVTSKAIGDSQFKEDTANLLENAGLFGTVKINDGNGTKPTLVWGGGGASTGTPIDIVYSTPLTFAGSELTKWPKNISSPADSDIWDSTNGTFIENPVISQYHTWRLQFSFSGKSSGATTGISVVLENTISGFIVANTVFLPNETTEGNFTVLFASIADTASIPSPVGTGQGYKISLTADDPITVTLDSTLRTCFAPQL